MTTLIYGTPEDSGVDPNRLAAMQKLAPTWCDGKQMRSGVLLFARRGRVVFHEAFGPLSPHPDSKPLQRDSIFSIASISKPITATIAMMLVEDGMLGLNRPIKEYLPEICGPGTENIEVQHLLTHTSGYEGEAATNIMARAMVLYRESHQSEKANLSDGPHQFVQAYLAKYCNLPSSSPPGSKMEYSDHNYAFLAEIIRRVSSKPLDQISRERLFDPLEMSDTTGVRDDAKKDRQVQRGRGKHWRTDREEATTIDRRFPCHGEGIIDQDNRPGDDR
jgi:CubicO group peptidase (beta-lactamase class C family)